MRLLVVDGNSIMNRAFYGIKVLTTKSGIYTNAVYGFLNILLKLKEMSQAEQLRLPLICMRRHSATECMRNIKRAVMKCLPSCAHKCR